MSKATLNSILAKINQEAGTESNPVQWIKGGSLTVKLVPLPDKGWEDSFVSYKSEYNGNVTTYFLIPAVIIRADDESIVDPTKVKYLRVPKTVLSKIYTQVCVDEWDYFDDTGALLTIRPLKSANRTDYDVVGVQHKKNVKEEDKFNHNKASWPNTTIEEAADRQSQIGKKDEKKDDSLPFM